MLRTVPHGDTGMDDGEEGVELSDMEHGKGSGRSLIEASVPVSSRKGSVNYPTIAFYVAFALIIIVLLILNSFLAIAFVACAALYLYIWMRIVRDVFVDTKNGEVVLLRTETYYSLQALFTCDWSRVKTSGWTLALWGTFALSLVGSALASTSIGAGVAEPAFIVIFGYNLLGLFAVLAVSLWISDAAFLAYRLINQMPSTATTLQHRRWKAAVGFVTFIVASIASIVIGYSDARTITIEIPVQGLPKCLDSFKIGVIADLFGPAKRSIRRSARHCIFECE